MPLLELLAWLLIAGGLLVIAGCIWLAFSTKTEVEIDPVVLPGEWNSWRSQDGPSSDPVSNPKKPDLDLQRDREREPAAPC
jgi:hypothetical protein